jgi:signal transduction histidine kinase
MHVSTRSPSDAPPATPHRGTAWSGFAAMTEPAARLPRERPARTFRPNSLPPYLLAVIAINVLDWITPPGVVVGIFLSIPIIASALLNGRRDVWVVTAVAMTGYVLQASFGAAPLLPAQVWVPNRIFVFLSMPAAGALALLLQRLRRAAEQARDEADAHGELNQLLMALLAHDLRTPLTLSVQALDYARSASRGDHPLDDELVGGLQARLQRSLRGVEVVLAVARGGRATTPGRQQRLPLSAIGPELAAEVESFADEARAQEKWIVLDFDEFRERTERVDALVLRQALAILLDNAIRHAVAGRIDVTARVESAGLVVRVRDQGPGFAASRQANGGHQGSGLGLRLVDALLVRVGGRRAVERVGLHGTCMALHLPLHAATGQKAGSGV